MTATERHTLKTLINQHVREHVLNGVCRECLQPLQRTRQKRFCSDRHRTLHHARTRRSTDPPQPNAKVAA